MASLQEVLENKDVAAELLTKETPEEAQAFLADKGVEISVDEVKAIGEALNSASTGELNADELEDVAGGSVAVAGLVIAGASLLVQMLPPRWWSRW